MNKFTEIINEVKKAINGKDKVIADILLAIIAGGNILIEDIPGVGKTTLALAFSKALSLDCKRVQFTPDTMPSDITGFSIYDKATNKFIFKKGAIFCNLFLADELNRTSSRTQAALLEAMEENGVTVDGKTFELEKPFSVIATQNPTGASGTQLLPDSQTDRFMIKLKMGYPDNNSEYHMLINRANSNPLDSVMPVVTKEELLQIQQNVKDVYMSSEIARYIVMLSDATRRSDIIKRGVSPRATIALSDMAKAMAYACSRDYVVPSDVAAVIKPTFIHRIILSSKATASQISSGDAVTIIFNKIKAPRA